MNPVATFVQMVLLGIFFCLVLMSLMVRSDTKEELIERRVFDAFAMFFLLVVLLIGFRKWSVPKNLFASIILTGIFFCLLQAFHSSILKMRAAIPKASKTQNLMLQIELGLHQFKKDCGRYPTNEEGIEALLENPKVKGWHGPYLDIPTKNDAWGENLILVTQKETYTLTSKGKDRILGTPDDLIRQSSPD